MDIPVFHDDQHGTAIISGAGLIAALELAGKKAEEVKVVVSGAGAGAIACTNFFMALGVRRENVYMFDSRGLLHKGRAGLNAAKLAFAQERDHGSLADVMRGADVFLGLSVGGMVTPDMVASMAANPIVFACANPDPEIAYPDAKAVRDDLIMATGRSDYPNQINNVLGFPFIFRGALDVQARTINEEMKMAAARALAALAKEPVPAEALAPSGLASASFGVDYIIPKALDPRVIEWVAPAVAEAAMRTGVARRIIDLDAYRVELRERMKAARARIGAFIDSYGLDF
jgi:malate dehydrogenase (oxaloacetate-decarboxylating)(NADP+)